MKWELVFIFSLYSWDRGITVENIFLGLIPERFLSMHIYKWICILHIYIYYFYIQMEMKHFVLQLAFFHLVLYLQYLFISVHITILCYLLYIVFHRTAWVFYNFANFLKNMLPSVQDWVDLFYNPSSTKGQNFWVIEAQMQR